VLKFISTISATHVPAL